MRLCVFCALAAAVIALLCFHDTPMASAQGKPVSFINDVAPVLKENCFACHDSKKRSGKYDMTTFEKLMYGGPGGEPIVAGKVKDSDFHDLMVTKEERRMPPRDKGEAVPKEKAEIIATWIAQGAKLDAGIDPKADLVKELRVRWKPPVAPVKYQYPAVINALAFSPDSKNLIVGGHHELTVWSVPEGKLTKRISMRAERAYALAFARDGKLIVAGGRPGQEGDVRVLDINAKATKTAEGVEYLNGVDDKAVMLKQLVDSDDSVLSLSLSKDGNKLAAGGCDRTIRIWDIAGGATNAKLEQTIENHADWVLGVAFTGDDKYLLSAARDKTAKVWDLKAKESVMTFPDHQNIVYGVAASNDGNIGYSIGADRQLRSWKPDSNGKQIKASAAHGDEVFKIAMHPTKPIIATGSADKSVRLWEATAVSNTKTLQGLTDHVFALAFSPNGELVAGGSFLGEVGIWNVADAKAVKVFNASPGYEAKQPEAPKK